MSARLARVDSGRIELRAPAPDPSVPLSGRLLALARQAHGTDTWACTRRESPRHVVWAGSAADARAWLREIADQEES